MENVVGSNDTGNSDSVDMDNNTSEDMVKQQTFYVGKSVPTFVKRKPGTVEPVLSVDEDRNGASGVEFPNRYSSMPRETTVYVPNWSSSDRKFSPRAYELDQYYSLGFGIEVGTDIHPTPDEMYINLFGRINAALTLDSGGNKKIVKLNNEM